MKSETLEPFKVGYGDEQIVFHPQLVTIAHQDEFTRRFKDIADTDEQKYQKEFDILIEAISEWSAAVPELFIKEKGESKRVPLVENAENTLDAMKQYFNERTPQNERILRAAYSGYISQMTPEINFF